MTKTDWIVRSAARELLGIGKPPPEGQWYRIVTGGWWCLGWQDRFLALDPTADEGVGRSESGASGGDAQVMIATALAC